jgi:integrase
MKLQTYAKLDKVGRSMAGQIIPRGENTFLVRVYLGRDPRTGKRRYHNHTVHGTPKDAQTYLNRVLRDRDLGEFVEASRITVDEYFDQWLKTVLKGSVSERTYDDYTLMLDRYIRPKIGHFKLSSLRPIHIQTIYAEMRERGLSSRTIFHVHTPINMALGQAVKWGMLKTNPCSLVQLPKASHREMQTMSVEEAGKFLETAQGDGLGFMFEFALKTGMRPEEYLALQWKDVDFERATVTVQRALIKRHKGGGWYFAEPKTPKARRNIPLTVPLLGGLREHKRKQAELRLKAGPNYQNYDLIFATNEGKPINRDVYTKRYKALLLKAGLTQSYRVYDLRHTCASLLLADGENPKVVSKRLGHADVAMTLRFYSHVLPSMQKGASERLESLLSANQAHKRHTTA